MDRDYGRKVQDAIRRVLMEDWDPIGINDVPEADDEYDSYIGRIYRLLANNASIEEIAEELERVELVEMGLPQVSMRSDTAKVAGYLKQTLCITNETPRP